MALPAASPAATTTNTTSPPPPSHCSVTAFLHFSPLSVISPVDYFNAMTSSVELKVDGKLVCKAAPDMPPRNPNSTTPQTICQAGGAVLNVVQMNMPAAIVGATALTAFIKAVTHFQVIKNEIGKQVQLGNPKIKCGKPNIKHLSTSTTCDWTYSAEFDCPSKANIPTLEAEGDSPGTPPAS